ncbi:hypothetical protein [Shimia biformata]|uniref:hypothetical protein n=1 Tax=Shimia biformata TaxID=1294299 RepID=UPI00194DD1AA|nr:hypothetical protein [Shimia biformata]
MKKMIPALLVAALAASPVLAASKAKQEFCQTNTDIIERLVALRLDKVSKKKAVAELKTGANPVPSNYGPAVDQWSEWIYSQPRKDAGQFSAKDFYEACLEK